MKAKKPLRRISEKRLKSLGGKAPYSTIAGPRKPLKRSSPPKPRCECGCSYSRHNRHAGRDDFRCDDCPAEECPRFRPRRSLRQRIPIKWSAKALKRSPIIKRMGKKKSRFPKRRTPKYRAWIKGQPCFLWDDARRHGCTSVGARWRIECIHIKTQGSGGDDRRNCLPACPFHHDEQEGRTKAFEAKYHVNLVQLALDYDARYEREARSQS